MRFVLLILVFGLSQAVSAEDLDDVEMGLDAAISESEAVMGEAEALEQIRIEEEEFLEQRRQEAVLKRAEANQKEKHAKVEIAKLDAQIVKAQKQRAVKEKQIRAAQKKIELYNQKLKKTQDQHQLVKTKLEAVTEAHDMEKRRLKVVGDQIREIRAEIKANIKLAKEQKRKYQAARSQRASKERDLASVKKKNQPRVRKQSD